MIGIAILLTAAAAAGESPGQCPDGMKLDWHTQQSVPEGTLHRWHCSPTLRQLEGIGTGQMDTCRGFDGGPCPTAATATATLGAAFPDISPEQIQRYSSNPSIRAAAGELEKATEAVRQAESRIDQLRESQRASTSAAERQRIQIDIARAEQQRQAARGAERLVNIRLKKVIREQAVVVE